MSDRKHSFPLLGQKHAHAESAPVATSGVLAKPRVRLAATAGDSVPLGASLTLPQPAPLPERGASFFLVLNLLSAAIAANFLILIINKL